MKLIHPHCGGLVVYGSPSEPESNVRESVYGCKDLVCEKCSETCAEEELEAVR